MSDEIRVVCGVVVNPGDRLIVGVHSPHLSRDEVVRMRLALQEQLPDVPVVVVTGVGSMAVLPADPPPDPAQEPPADAGEIRCLKERTAARLQRDRLIMAIREHLNGNCGRSTVHLHDAVDLVEHEIDAAGR